MPRGWHASCAFGIVLFFGRGFTRFSGLVKRLDTKVESQFFGSVPFSFGSCARTGALSAYSAATGS